MSKKNIWIINQYTGSAYYGMNYRSYYLAKEFIKKGNDVTIFSGSYSHLFSNYPRTEGIFTKDNIENIDYIWVKTPKYKGSKSIGRFFNMLVFMINILFFNIFKMKKPDVIIVSSLSLFPVLNAYIWSKLLKIEFIFEVRDIWPLTLIEMGNMSQYHPLVLFLGWFERLGYKKSKYVVSVLPRAREYMISRGMDSEKFVYIPNGVNLDEVKNYQEVNNKIRSMIPHDKFVVGYVGTVGIANAMDYFLKAAYKLRKNMHIHFVLIGKGGEKKKLENFSNLHKMLNVTFIDEIPKVQVQSVLSLFSICYIGWHKKKIYEYGVSANKIFDYMYSGKPILHSIDVFENIVQDTKCGITVNAEDSSAIADGILNLYNKNDDELNIMGINGKNYVINHHSYLNLVEKYMEII